MPHRQNGWPIKYPAPFNILDQMQRLICLCCRSFLCGGSTGFFVYGYCLYYYYARSDMSGFMQTSFFFGYMACICYAFFLMLGMVGFRASLFFVRHIYKSIKCEWAVVGRSRAAELYPFLVPPRSPKYRKKMVCSRVQQEQLVIAMFQIRPLFIVTANEPINLFRSWDCYDKIVFFCPMYYLPVTSDGI